MATRRTPVLTYDLFDDDGRRLGCIERPTQDEIIGPDTVFLRREAPDYPQGTRRMASSLRT